MTRGESETGSRRPLYSVERIGKVCNPFGSTAQAQKDGGVI